MQTKRKLIERERLPETVSESDLNSWEFHYKKIKSNLEGSEEEKEAIIRRRILRYFGQFKLQSENYFSTRLNLQDPQNPFLKINTCELLLYGTDYLSISRAKQYFGGFTTQIRGVDDSHFLVEFRNERECFEAFLGKILKEKLTFQFNSPLELFQKSPPKSAGWVEIQPYKQFIFQRKLMARFLTNFDRIQEKSPSARSSFYYAFSEAKRKFIKSLKDSLLQNNDKTQRKFDKSRSRQKQYEKKQPHREMTHPTPCYRDYQPCQCFRYRTCCCNSHNFYPSNHFQKRRNRSPSIQSYRSSSISSKDDEFYHKRSRREERLTLLQQKMVEDSDYKFQLYLKNRQNKAQTPIPQQTLPNRISSQNDSQSLYLINPQNRQNKNQKNDSKDSENTNKRSNCTKDGDSLIIQPNLVYPDNNRSISGIMKMSNGGKNLDNFSKIEQELNINGDLGNEDSMNFELYLQKLKLEDSQEYSAFDLDIQ